MSEVRKDLSIPPFKGNQTTEEQEGSEATVRRTRGNEMPTDLMDSSSEVDLSVSRNEIPLGEEMLPHRAAQSVRMGEGATPSEGGSLYEQMCQELANTRAALKEKTDESERNQLRSAQLEKEVNYLKEKEIAPVTSGARRGSVATYISRSASLLGSRTYAQSTPPGRVGVAKASSEFGQASKYEDARSEQGVSHGSRIAVGLAYTPTPTAARRESQVGHGRGGLLPQTTFTSTPRPLTTFREFGLETTQSQMRNEAVAKSVQSRGSALTRANLAAVDRESQRSARTSPLSRGAPSMYQPSPTERDYAAASDYGRLAPKTERSYQQTATLAELRQEPVRPQVLLQVQVLYPGVPGAPVFTGSNITRFLKEYESLCEDWGWSSAKKTDKLPGYVGGNREFLRDQLESMDGYRDQDWQRFVRALHDEFDHQEEQKYTESRLTTICEAFRKDTHVVNLDTFVAEFHEVSQRLVEDELLLEYKQVEQLIYALPSRLRENVLGGLGDLAHILVQTNSRAWKSRPEYRYKNVMAAVRAKGKKLQGTYLMDGRVPDTRGKDAHSLTERLTRSGTQVQGKKNDGGDGSQR